MSVRWLRTSPWPVAFGSAVALTVGVAPLFFTTFGLFIEPLSSDLGWSRGAVSAAITATALAGGVSAPIMGRMIDRFGFRRIVIPSLILFCCSVALVGVAPGNAIALYGIFIAVGLFSNAANTLSYMIAISTWFDKRRGLALGIAACGIGIGGTFVPAIANFLIGSFGWRVAYLGLGLLAAVVSIPMVALFVRTKPVATRAEMPVVGRGSAVAVSPETSRVKGQSLKEAASGRRFWIIGLTSLVVGTFLAGTQTHLVPLLVGGGQDLGAAVGLIAILSVSSMAARLIGGFLLDRVHAAIVAVIVFLLPIASFALLVNNSLLVLAAILLGAAVGAEVDIIGFLISRYFGLRHYGQLFGIVTGLFVLGGAAGPLLFGVIYDATGSYAAVFPWLAIGLILSAVAMSTLGKYQFVVEEGRDSMLVGANELTEP